MFPYDRANNPLQPVYSLTTIRASINGIYYNSYLTNITQYVSINDTNSTCINVTCGVPQSSTLGPSLFILYINDMHTVSSLMKCIIFADDTNLLYTCNDISEMCQTVSKELDKLSSWFMANKLSLIIFSHLSHL